MILIFKEDIYSYQADVSKPLEIGISVHRDHSVSSFSIPGAMYQDYKSGNFIGNKSAGGPCNLETITFTPHGNSTHTECLGHIAQETYFVNDCIIDQFIKAELVTLSTLEGGKYLDFPNTVWESMKNVNALIIRTLPNNIGKINKDYSGQNAPAISAQDMQKIVDAGILHLVIDLPSVDPEWDNGTLLSHHIFWNYPNNPRLDASITEFAYIRDDISDGRYMLKLNISNFESDAAPSRPVLYSLSEL